MLTPIYSWTMSLSREVDLSAGRLLELPSDIHAMIMASLDDLKTLQSLLIAFPSMAIPFSASFSTITRAILKRSSRYMGLYQYLYAILAARSIGALDQKQLQHFLELLLWGRSSAPSPSKRASKSDITRVYDQRRWGRWILPRIRDSCVELYSPLLQPMAWAPLQRMSTDEISDAPCPVADSALHRALSPARGFIRQYFRLGRTTPWNEALLAPVRRSRNAGMQVHLRSSGSCGWTWDWISAMIYANPCTSQTSRAMSSSSCWLITMSCSIGFVGSAGRKKNLFKSKCHVPWHSVCSFAIWNVNLLLHCCRCAILSSNLRRSGRCSLPDLNRKYLVFPA